MTPDADSALPEEFFVFVTTQDPALLGLNEWLPLIPNPSYPDFLSSQAMRTLTNYRAEYVRRRGFRGAPSRLSAVFAWGSLDDAREAAMRSGSRYKGKPLKRCILRGSPLRVLRANSEIIPLALRLEAKGASKPEVIESVWGTYWSGAADRVGFNAVSSSDLITRDYWSREEPLWEWLLDGSLDVVEDIAL